jgi:hypothetical protein
MESVLTLLAVACCAGLALALARLGSMIPNSTWGGLYPAAEGRWGRPRSVSVPDRHATGSDRQSSPASIEPWDGSVESLVGVRARAPRWRSDPGNE